MAVYIYGLIDPITKEIRYIGKSIRPHGRLNDHCNDKSVTWRTNWIQSLLRQGLKPELTILEELPDECNWQEKEREWIAKGKEFGWPLTNCTSGGDGVPDLPSEIREKMRSTWLGRKHSPESLKRIGDASRGRHHTEAHKEYMRQIMKDREFAPEWRFKISEKVGKLRLCDVLEIKKSLSEGVKVKDLAAQYGVKRTTISLIKAVKSYKDVCIGASERIMVFDYYKLKYVPYRPLIPMTLPKWLQPKTEARK